MEDKSCTCGKDDKLVIACSGAADLGCISDQVARKLSKNTNRKMSCLALFAVCSDEKITELKTKNILVIDGCNVDCGRKILQKRGIDKYEYLRITDLGYIKGQTPVIEENLNSVYDNAYSF